MSRRLRRCTMMIGATIAALALIASITAAAPASASAPHPARSDSAHAGLALPSAPPAPGLHVMGVVHVDVSGFAPATKSGTVLGYIWCLAAAANSCVGDTSEPRCCTAAAGGPSFASRAADVSLTDLVLAFATGVAGNAGYALVIWFVKRIKSWSFVAKYLYHYKKRLHFAPYAGACEGDFGYDRVAILANCNSPSGIYWQPNKSGGTYALWNTKGRGDLIASCNCRGTKLFDARPRDFVRWGLWEVVA
jgi:hypothetical protein